MGEAIAGCLAENLPLTKEALSYGRVSTDILGQIILCGGDSPVHYRMLSSVSGPHILDARKTHTHTEKVVITKKSPDIVKCP